MATVIAVVDGFYDNRRIRAGVEFEVPEGKKGKWFVPKAEYKAPVIRNMDASRSTSKRESESFVFVMKQLATAKEPVPEPVDTSKKQRSKRAMDNEVL